MKASGRIETRLLRSMSIQESFEQWLALQQTFEPQLQETTALFAEERRLWQICKRGCSAWQHGRQNMIDLFQSIQKLQELLDSALSYPIHAGLCRNRPCALSRIGAGHGWTCCWRILHTMS
jgi:hypothetical protein